MTLALASAITALLSAQVKHEFVFTAPSAGVKTVHVAGTFNGWSYGTNPMTVDPDGRTWRTDVTLDVGKHLYKFVLNGTDWITDPNAKTETDGGGHVNSVLLLAPEGYGTPAKRGDGVLTETAIRHAQASPMINFDRGRLSLRVDVRSNDAQRVEAKVTRGGKAETAPMRVIDSNELRERYEYAMPWDGKSPLSYRFVITDGATRRAVTMGGKDFQVTATSYVGPRVPNWVEKTIFYQIFPDRFENGDAKNDPAEVSPWSAMPTYLTRFGGDAVGIEKRLDHLKKLGVNGVYINPIMKAPAYHRYDPVDFYQVDPEFGTNQEFGRLTRAMQSNGIRVVLDQIFDHVGTTFPPFVDLLKNQQASKFKDYFFVNEWPVEVRKNPPYLGWYNVESMPKVNLANPELKKYLLDSVNFWHEHAQLSGWRLDVANEVPQWFWREFRQRVKTIDPDAWIVGEVWSDANQWLQGDQWDASMNYPFQYAVRDFLAKKTMTAKEFTFQLMQVYGLYAPQVSRNQLNFLSTHDTPRFIHEAGNDRSAQKLAAVVQFTWPGAPSVYYGEELGMEGAHDPDNRRPMRWDLANDGNDMFAHYRKLIALRHRHPILVEGDPVALETSNSTDVAAFGRTLGAQRAVIAINRANSPQTAVVKVNNFGKGADVLGSQAVTSQSRSLTIRLAPRSAAVVLNRRAYPETVSIYHFDHSNHSMEAPQ
ncbi:MAG: DUF3459 domain-containing protein [Chthonomonas sp.]|nr:DUF3459 domain-containing protein [Chthonomonas sp.]